MSERNGTGQTSVWVVRTWKRDGSQNAMTLENAVHNVWSNDVKQRDGDSRKRLRSKGEIARLLLAGEAVHTKWAVFEAWASGEDAVTVAAAAWEGDANGDGE
jgi:hypothetical protein